MPSAYDLLCPCTRTVTILIALLLRILPTNLFAWGGEESQNRCQYRGSPSYAGSKKAQVEAFLDVTALTWRTFPIRPTWLEEIDLPHHRTQMGRRAILVRQKENS